MCSTCITDFIISFLTIEATPYWCLSFRPLYHIILLLSVNFSPVPFNLTSARPRKCHLYFSSSHLSSSIFPHGFRVRTFHDPIVVILCIVLDFFCYLIPVAALSFPHWRLSMDSVDVVIPSHVRSGMFFVFD